MAPSPLFDRPLPILQAPMAGTATPALAAAVSNAGGLGGIGTGSSPLAAAREMILATHALTTQPFNVNLFCHQPALHDAAREAAWIAWLAPLFAELSAEPPAAAADSAPGFVDNAEATRMVLDTRPAVVSFHFGLPTPAQIAALRAAGIRMLATATSLAEAERIAAAGLDAVIAQGVEAGGHRGIFDPAATDEQLSTAVLTRLLAQKSPMPVVAAGGIMDGHGIRAMLDLGAAAAQLGTAFILCPESAASGAYRARLKSPQAAITRLTTAISGRPARGIVNRLIARGESAGHPTPPAYPFAYSIAKRLIAAANAANSANHEIAAHWAGQGAPLARDLPAADLMAQLVAELRQP